MNRFFVLALFALTAACTSSMDLGGKIVPGSIVTGGGCTQNSDCVAGDVCSNQSCVPQASNPDADAGVVTADDGGEPDSGVVDGGTGADAGPHTCPGPASSTAPTFGSTILFNTNGGEGVGVSVGDVNSDGIPDVMQWNEFAGSNYDAGSYFNVYFGLGDGGLGDPEHLAYSPIEYNFAAAFDPDGGGAIGAVSNGNILDILTADGARLGGIPRQGLNLGSGLVTFAVADLDRNGLPDFVICGEEAVSAYLNLGGYAFGEGSTLSLLPCEAIASGDVNGDGVADLVFSGPGIQSGEHPTSDAVTVMNSQADGGYVLTSYATGSTGLGLSLVLADLNGDGLPDIAVAGDPGFFVLLNLGGGLFSTPVSYSADASLAQFLAVADLNGDCWPDVVVTNGYGCGSPRIPFTAHIFLNNGDGTFSAENSLDSGLGDPFALAAYQGAGAVVPSLIISDVCTGQMGLLPNSTTP